MTDESVNRPFVDPTITPRRVTGSEPPAPAYRPLRWYYPCFACHALNPQPAEWPVPTACPVCGSPRLLTPHTRRRSRGLGYEGERLP